MNISQQSIADMGEAEAYSFSNEAISLIWEKQRDTTSQMGQRESKVS
jgi:hypothetical protein